MLRTTTSDRRPRRQAPLRSVVAGAAALVLGAAALIGVPALTSPAGAVGPTTSVLSGSDAHACVIGPDGSLACWGLNGVGQIGDGTTTDRVLVATAVDLAALPAGATVTSVGAGASSSCLLTDAGEVYCWGFNGDGAVGDGTTTARTRPVAVDVTGLPEAPVFTYVSVGASVACAVDTAGAVFCWGRNLEGQLGDGTTTSRSVPTPVDATALPPGTQFTSVSVERTHACGVTSTGALYCWGAHPGGASSVTVPTAVDVSLLPPGTAFQSLDTGTTGTCAVTTTGEIYCWGSNNNCELGDCLPSMAAPERAVQAVTLDPGETYQSVSLSGGLDEQHACAITSAGRAVCWGGNSYRQGGDQSANLPIGTTFAAVAALQNGTCALGTTGSVHCWGAAGWGGPGEPVPAPGFEGTPEYAGYPRPLNDWAFNPPSVTVAAIDATASEAGGDTGLIRFTRTGPTTTDLQVTWTYSGTAEGRDDLPTPPDYRIPTGLTTAVIPAGSSFVDVEIVPVDDDIFEVPETVVLAPTPTTEYAVLVPFDLARVEAVVTITSDDPPVAQSSGVGSLTAGATHSCAVVGGSGDAYCWGFNNEGQLGDGTRFDRSEATPVVAGAAGPDPSWAAVAAGWSHTCAVTSGGTVACWGSNESGELGTGSAGGTSATPVPVSTAGLPGGTGFTSVSTGNDYSCAQATTGTTYCWGSNSFGRLGNGTVTDRAVPTPVAAPGGIAFSQISTGDNQACGLTADGVAYCWGNNGRGQLGDGSFTDRSAPVAVDTTLRFAQISTNGGKTCAVDTAKQVWCWGGNDTGQLGTGAGGPGVSPRPVALDTTGLPTGTAFASVAAGLNHACAVTEAGSAWCWGLNRFGQLGDGSTVTRLGPVQVVDSPLPAGQTFEIAAAGNEHTCALTSTGAAFCWGYGALGQIGDGTATDRPVPAAVVGLPLSQPPVPVVVTVQGVDLAAAEAGPDPATIRFVRTGPLGSPLTVSYAVSGSASLADYTPALTGTVAFPAGSATVDLVITPVDDALVEAAETVTVTASPGSGYTVGSPSGATVTITDNDVAVPAGPQLLVSLSPDRSASVALDGTNQAGRTIYVHVPSTGVRRVVFTLDGRQSRTERFAPFDLRGTAPDGSAVGLDTRTLSPGPHTVVARVTLTDGTVRVLSATFTAGSFPAPVLRVSTDRDRDPAVPLAGATLTGRSAYIFVEAPGARRVTFLLDRRVARTDSVAPFDLRGGSATAANPLPLRRLAGTRTVTALVSYPTGPSQIVRATFTVR